jgi:oxygen-independent coproporphyrinogen-3 oxidase
VPGVYISYPFCAQKCSFCNFASGPAAADDRVRYRHALMEEVRAHRWAWLPDTMYFGGGTPSLMPPDLLCEICGAIPEAMLREVTLECAPGTVTGEAVTAWRDSGINRVSLGVQSFVPAELRTTGRRHTAEMVRDDIELLRGAGIENINLDLIAGLPEQTGESWEDSLDWIDRLAPPHVSVYIFEVDEDSRLGKELLLGGVRYGAARVPEEELVARLYERAVQRLDSAGIARYEISNFARRGWESRHNLKYWRLEPYVGFGLDAHSFDGKKRWANPDTLATYLGRNAAGQETVESDGEEEHFFVGLRLTSGIVPSGAERVRFERPISKWLEAGMLEWHGSKLRLSSQGVLVSNEIFQDFIDAW